MTAEHDKPTVELTEQQRRAVEHAPTPLRIIAGAGSGKTTVMAKRIEHLVQQGTRPDQVLALTFSNKAATNLRAKVRELLGPGSDVQVSTYHGFGAALVEEHVLELGLPEGVRVLDRAQAWQLTFDAFDDLTFEVRRTGRPAGIADAALRLASRAADHLVPITAVMADCEAILADPVHSPEVHKAAGGRLELCRLVEAYEERKRRLGLIDFGDQIRLAVQLLEADPDLAESLHRRWPVVLLDEYQDTNYAQRRLLELLYPPGSCITAVGDDMQSIYAFRGAHLRNILDFSEHFGADDAPCENVSLEICFRSGPSIVALANHVQDQVPDATDKELRPQEKPPVSRIECFRAADDTEEAREIAHRIAALGQAGTPWHEIAVLCRKRKIIAAIAHELTAAGVPCEIIGIGGLLTRPEVIDALAWLEVLALEDPTVAVLRILRGPRYRIGMRDLAAMARAARRADPDSAHRRIDLLAAVAEADSVPGISAAAWARVKELLARRRILEEAAKRLPLPALLEEVLRETMLWRVADDTAHENLLRLLALAERFEPTAGSDPLRGFLEWTRLLLESEDEPAEAVRSATDAVQVMSVHQAKGLEFDAVFVAGLAGGSSRTSSIFPDERLPENPATQQDTLPYWLRRDHEGFLAPPRTRAEENQMKQHGRDRRRNEELRLLYVALTRARKVLVCSTGQWYPGPQKPQGPSEFYDLVRSRTDLVTEAFARPVAVDDPAVAAKERRADEVRARAAAATTDRARRSDRTTEQQGSLLTPDAGRTVPRADGRPLPDALSASAIVSFARCPRQFEWTTVRPMPRRSSVAAQLGSEIHRWIEERADAQLPLGIDIPADDDATPWSTASSTDELVSAEILDPDDGHRGSLEQRRANLRTAFLASPYADRVAARIEAPFTLPIAGTVLRGRVDAVYGRPGDEIVDVVDFKTGRPPRPGDRSAGVQLDVYGLVAVRAWGIDPKRLRTTYCYLGSDGTVTLDATDWDLARVASVEARLEALVRSVHARRFDPTPGGWCRGCDFSSICTAGIAEEVP